MITEQELTEKLQIAEVVYHKLGHGSNSELRPRSEDFKSGIPDFARKIIAAEARSEVATNKDIARSWGISGTAVNFAEQGRIGNHQKRNSMDDIDSIAENIVNKTLRSASDKLFHAVESIDADEVKNEKPIAQTVIARNLATVIEKLTPKAINQTNIQFNVFTPRTKKIEEFGEPIRVLESVVRR